jgi:hypothetical protein
VTSGALPAGLTLASTGLLSGTPTTAAGYTFTVAAHNTTAPDATVTVAVSVAAAPPTVANVYGSATGIDGKANTPIGEYKMAIKFRASTTSALTGIRFTQRSGPGGYSAGTFGTMTIQIRPDDGSGQPHASTVLASMTFDPVGDNTTNTEKYELKTFPAAPNLTAGTIYYVVFSNSGGITNYISVNSAYCGVPVTPRQPRFVDSDFAVMKTASESSVWSFSTVSTDTPVCDLVYANAVVDGQCYYESMDAQYQPISGTNLRVRENILVSDGNKTVTGVYVRVRRTSGTSPLILTLKDAAGTTVNSVSIPSTAIPVSAPGASAAGAVWVGGAFSGPATLVSGSQDFLELSTAAGTTYTTWPIRAKGNPESYTSFSFTSGLFEYATTATNWARGYYAPYQVNVQACFTLA